MPDLSLLLAPIRAEDWRAVHSWARLPEASRYQVWGPSTEEQTREFVAGAVAHWDENPQRVLTHAVWLDGEVVGLGTLKIHSEQHRQGELSYATHPKVWGRGVGTAIGRELLRIGFVERNLHRIAGTCEPRNIGSRRILEKLGMTHEGRAREVQLISDGWRDSELFSILAHEWEPSGERGVR